MRAVRPTRGGSTGPWCLAGLEPARAVRAPSTPVVPPTPRARIEAGRPPSEARSPQVGPKIGPGPLTPRLAGLTLPQASESTGWAKGWAEAVSIAARCDAERLSSWRAAPNNGLASHCGPPARRTSASTEPPFAQKYRLPQTPLDPIVRALFERKNTVCDVPKALKRRSRWPSASK